MRARGGKPPPQTLLPLSGRALFYFAQLSDEHEPAPVLSARAAFLYSSDL